MSSLSGPAHQMRDFRWANRIMAAWLVLALAFTAGCQDNGAANGCAAGQKTGGSVGDGIGKFVGTTINGFVPRQLRSYTGSLDIKNNSRAAFSLLGSRIGCALNTADRSKAVESIKIATITGKTQTWSGSEPGVSGRTRVIASDSVCRTVQQTITLADGTQQSEDVKSCKGPSGWEVVSE